MSLITHQLQSLLDRILTGDRPRSVFLIDDEVVSCPAGGQIEARWLKRSEAVFVGTYDCEASADRLMEDIQAAQVG